MARSEFWRRNPSFEDQRDEAQWRGTHREARWQRERDDDRSDPGYRMADELPPHSTRDEEQQFGGRRNASFNDRWENAYEHLSPREFRRAGGLPGPMNSQWQRPGQGYVRATGSAWLDRSDPSMSSGSSLLGYGSGASFRGRGPKGYQRSDDRIREDVCECLMEDDHLDASDIEVAVRDCEVTLSGVVNSRWEKRRAEDLVEMLSAVQDVHNELRVNRGQSSMRDRNTPRGNHQDKTTQCASEGNQEDIDSRH